MTPRELPLMTLPAAVALLGGVLAALWHPTARARSLIQHVAAGTVLAALAVELLPEIEREHAPGLGLALTSQAPGGARVAALSGGLGLTVVCCAAAGKSVLFAGSLAFWPLRLLGKG